VQESGPPAILHPGRIPFSAAVIAGAVIALGVTGVMLIRGLVTQQIGPATAAAALSLAATFIPQVLAALRIPSAYERRNHALETITRWLDKPTLLRITPHAPDLVRGPGGLEFRDARVLGCLEGLTATAPAGNAIALSGRDVMARSTVLALAARLLDPDWGHVYLDGQDLSCYSDASAHRLVGLASSRRLPSEGTVETRLLTRDDVPGAWMSKALGWCEVDKLICELPEGSVTQMRDPRLTPGQRLRLSLAYALLMRPSVLLLDDTLDPLDAAAVTSLERVMNGFEGTLLIVTQNLDHLAMADEVWYLDGGRLLESGPPSELLAFDGPTAALFGLGDAASA
ncbi:MAG: ATP-binding cassette domain-containing protein, partial [Actinomycetota bacterium]